MSIRSEDIRNQSQKLSKIVPNFGHFALPNFVRGTSCKINVHLITQASSHLPW